MDFFGIGKETAPSAGAETVVHFYRFLDSGEEVCEGCDEVRTRSDMEFVGHDDSEDALSLYQCRTCATASPPS